MLHADEIRAARALLHLDQADLAERAHVSVVTIRRVEAADAVSPATVASIRRALEEAGVEFIENGVRRRRAPRQDAASRYDALRAISLRSAAMLADAGRFTEADLYDEDGLPA